MLRRDFIKDEIDRFGEFLRLLFEKLLAIEGSSDPEEFRQNVDKGLTELLNLSLAEQDNMSTEEFLNFILSETKNVKSVSFLADIYFMLGEKGNPDNELTQGVYTKTLALYQHVQENDSTFSLQIHQRIEELQTKLAH
ncbi:MAG: hypothetical protein NXI20_22935 [bacterium]|nr:hypothetical protein [bacterium]